ncbi:MAG: hypothetical protein A4E35_01179 [Methanoregula sp. PtaU1.Bin051]|nr:MAG: hypothetical protein A4E35_01179 [Methanoregula sp. PtaU1.Bin051]
MQSAQSQKYYTKDHIPLYRRFDGERYFLIGTTFRKQQTAMKFAKEIRTPYPKGIGAIGEKARVVKSPSGKTWLVYRTGEPKDWKGVNF